MKSRWFNLKGNAIELRKHGVSIGSIEQRLGIPRSTLSGWFRGVAISQKHKERLLQNKKRALVKAREKAVAWHRAQKEQRIVQAQKEAEKVLAVLDTNNPTTVELALALLYLGEGAKKSNETAMGSSDPLILKFFISALKGIYGINTDQIRCELSLRADQNPRAIKQFWAKELGLSLDKFKYVAIDKRTVGTKTYSYYKGVCHVRCGNIAIQRKLTFLTTLFCNQVIKKYSGT